MAADLDGAELVHSHTWYANLAGHLAKLLHGVPHVATTHSLEPSRPVEGRAARRRLPALELVRAHGPRGRGRGDRGLDRRCATTCSPPTRRRPVARARDPATGSTPSEYERGRGARDALERYGVDREPYRALRRADHEAERARRPARGGAASLEGAQLVLAAGAPDTDELARETERGRSAAGSTGRRLDREDARRSRR